MRTIYSQCTKVLIWLGEIRGDVPSSGVESVFEYFTSLQDSYNPVLPELTQSQERLEAFRKALDSLHPSQCAWWTRIWTVQEAVLPSSADLVWGHTVRPWYRADSQHGTRPEQTFADFPVNVFIRNWDLAFFLSIDESLKDAGRLISAKIQQRRPTESMIAWRGRQAKDLRDKVFGQLGLWPAGTLPRSEKADYSLAVVDVFCSVTLDLMHNDRDLHVLASDPRLEESAPGLPRWALDLGAEPRYKTIWTADSVLYHRYNANQGLSVTELPRLADGKLTLEGLAVDRVKLVDDAAFYTKGGNLKANMLKALRSWYRLFSELAKQDTEADESASVKSSTSADTFASLVLGGVFRKFQVITREASRDDMQAVLDFIESGEINGTEKSLDLFIRHRKFFATDQGRVGLGHLETEPGDEMWVFEMSKIPFTLRRRTAVSDLEYDFAGAAYVHGIMNGELFEENKRNLAKHVISTH